MSSVWLHPKSVNWVARYRGSKGKTINRSTGTSDREEAKRIAQTWEVEAARDREKQKTEVSAGGISDTLARAERLARLDRIDAATARDLINDILAASGREAIEAVSNRTWFENWRKSKSPAVTQRTRWKYNQVCRDWLAFLNGRAEKPLEIVGKADAIAFRDRIAQEGLAARTVNQTIKLVRGIYAEAVEQGYIGRNPFAGVDRLPENTEDTKREPFTTKEVADLIAVATGDLKGLIILAATTGLRLMDGARIKWSNIDLKDKLIKIKTSKTGARLTLPIHHAFEAWLKDQPRGIGMAQVFPSLAHKGGPGKTGLSMQFKRLMEKANVNAGIARKREGRGRTTCQKSFHSLRHFAATQLAQNGVRAEVAMAITGHADEESHAGYIDPDVKALRKAVNGIKISA